MSFIITLIRRDADIDRDAESFRAFEDPVGTYAGFVVSEVVGRDPEHIGTIVKRIIPGSSSSPVEEENKLPEIEQALKELRIGISRELEGGIKEIEISPSRENERKFKELLENILEAKEKEQLSAFLKDNPLVINSSIY